MSAVTTAGFAFVEFVCPELAGLVALFGKLGFKPLGQHAQTGAVLLRQNEAALIVNPEPNPFRDIHGASARAIAIHVDNAANALAQALEGGARRATPAEFGAFVADAPAIAGIGDSLVYFVDHDIESAFSTPYRPAQPAGVADAAIQAIDHTSNIVKPENLDHWADFYRDTFAFVQKQYLDVKGRQTGMRARSMVSPCGKVSIPIAAAAHDQPGVLNQNEEFIRDYRGEGIQLSRRCRQAARGVPRDQGSLHPGGCAGLDHPRRRRIGQAHARCRDQGRGRDARRVTGSGRSQPGTTQSPRDPETSMTKTFASHGDTQIKTTSFTQLSDNAYAYTAQGDPNSGVVIGDDSVLVVDTTATPAMAQDLIAKIRAVTDKPIRHLVLSHYHAVRVLGASAFLAHGCQQIIASRGTYNLIAERGAQDMQSEIERLRIRPVDATHGEPLRG